MTALYLVRVELINGERLYNDLHAKMEAAGFLRTFSTANVAYRLPPAEYVLFKESTTAPVIRDLAKQAADSISPGGCRVVVARTTGDANDFSHVGLLKG